MKTLLDDTQRQLIIEALINKPTAAATLLRRAGYTFPEEEMALVALLSGTETKVWVEK